MILRLIEFMDSLVVWYMLKRWDKAHSATIKKGGFVLTMYTQNYYERVFKGENKCMQKS